jgi:tRNA wybutosine-synthesizing protein 1
MLPSNVKSLLEKQQYRIVGKHSAVKVCYWTKQRLTQGRSCYKELWYKNVQSHRCMQMTPFLGCNYRCTYCWRIHSGDRPGYVWQEYPAQLSELDDPGYIIEEAVKMRKSLLIGYKANLIVDPKVFEEALRPSMVTFSLTGEPTLYPRLGELIREAKKRGMVTYLVTNGSMPETLEKLEPLPDQLYVSIQAPDEEVFRKIARPLVKDAWSRLLKTLELFPSLGTRRILRITLVKGFNDSNPGEYAKLIEISNPDYVEVKAYEWVGESQSRLPKEAMPWMSDIIAFSEKISEASGYVKKGEFEPSGVVLLSRI